MSDTENTAPAAATAPTANDGADGFEARLDALRGEARADGLAASEPAVEESAAPAPSAADSDAASRAEARRARLAALQQTLRKQVDSKTPRQSEDLAAKYEARARELEAKLAKMVDPDSLDPERFFEVAERAKADPRRLAEWLQQKTLNPERVAAEAAQKALDPRIAAAEERAAKAEARVEAFLQQMAQREAAQQEAQVFQGFVQSITPDEAPMAASFLDAFGPDQFQTIVKSAANGLPEGAGRQALLDVIEENLERLVRGLSPATRSATSNGQHAIKTPAAAKATTVSNTLAQERASVVDDDDWSSLPFEDRLARMKASA